MKDGKLNLLEKTVLGLAGIAAVVTPLKSTRADPVNLKLTNTFVNSSYTPDSFTAAYDPNNANLSDGIDPNDVEQSPNYVDWNFIQAYTTDTGRCLTQDYRAFDPNSDNSVSWNVNLMAEDYELMQGFTGTSRVTLDDPNELDKIPSQFNVYIRRFDETGNLADTYNLRDPNDYTDPNSHSIDWAVTNALGNYGNLELVVKKSTNPADLNGDGVVNFQDFVYLSRDWQKTNGTYTADIDGDGDVDADDLAYLSENWLYDQWGGQDE